MNIEQSVLPNGLRVVSARLPGFDSAAVGDLPTGGIQTGGGATAVHVSSAGSTVVPGLIGIGSVLALIAAAVIVFSRRSAASVRRAG